jgi:hypothetical protein
LDAAKAAGLRVLASLNTEAGDNFSAETARRAVAQYDRHPALWAWYLADEPDLSRIPPDAVRQAQRYLDSLPARKPTGLTLWDGGAAGNYGGIADITFIDRYPIPWLPLANFPQHVRLARLGLGANRPLVAVIQAFDWSKFPEFMPGETGLRPPTYAELRCMAYCALAERANGLFFFTFSDPRWRLEDQPEVWASVCGVTLEVQERLPLFTAEHAWWPKNHDYPDPSRRFNAALHSSVTSTLLHVRRGGPAVPAGYYVLAVNTTGGDLEYRFSPPWPSAGPVPVLGENRSASVQENTINDRFAPYDVHVYGPLLKPARDRVR